MIYLEHLNESLSKRLIHQKTRLTEFKFVCKDPWPYEYTFRKKLEKLKKFRLVKIFISPPSGCILVVTGLKQASKDAPMNYLQEYIWFITVAHPFLEISKKK